MGDVDSACFVRDGETFPWLYDEAGVLKGLSGASFESMVKSITRDVEFTNVSADWHQLALTGVSANAFLAIIGSVFILMNFCDRTSFSDLGNYGAYCCLSGTIMYICVWIVQLFQVLTLFYSMWGTASQVCAGAYLQSAEPLPELAHLYKIEAGRLLRVLPIAQLGTTCLVMVTFYMSACRVFDAVTEPNAKLADDEDKRK